MTPEEIEEKLKSLDERDRKVFELRMKDKTVEQISQELFISSSLIYNKINPKIFKAFGVKNWEEVVRVVGGETETVDKVNQKRAIAISCCTASGAVQITFLGLTIFIFTGKLEPPVDLIILAFVGAVTFILTYWAYRRRTTKKSDRRDTV